MTAEHAAPVVPGATDDDETCGFLVLVASDIGNSRMERTIFVRAKNAVEAQLVAFERATRNFGGMLFNVTMRAIPLDDDDLIHACPLIGDSLRAIARAYWNAALQVAWNKAPKETFDEIWDEFGASLPAEREDVDVDVDAPGGVPGQDVPGAADPP